MSPGMRDFLNSRYPGLVEQIEDPDKRIRFEVAAYLKDMRSTGDLPRAYFRADIPALVKKVRRDATRQGVKLVGDVEEALLALCISDCKAQLEKLEGVKR